MINNDMITTGLEIPNHRIVGIVGVTRGIIVRSRNVISNFGASLQALVGGNISIYTSLCERARRDAFDMMRSEAEKIGANAIIGMRYDANEIGPGITEVLAYGTAVIVTPIQ